MNAAKIERNYLVAHSILELALFYAALWFMVEYLQEAEFGLLVCYLFATFFVLAKSGLHFMQAIVKQKESECTSN